MRTPEERRAEVHLLASKKIREGKKRIRTSVYCLTCVALVCSVLFLIPYVGGDDNIAGTKKHTDGGKIDAIGGYTDSYVKSVELIGEDISKEYTDRPTITLVNLCIKDITKGEYTLNTDFTSLYTLTYNYSDGSKAVYELAEDSLVFNNRCYAVSDEQYCKLLNYLE